MANSKTKQGPQTSELHVPAIYFLGEQDGPPERELKKLLAPLFQGRTEVLRAYLARLTYGSGSPASVAALYPRLTLALRHHSWSKCPHCSHRCLAEPNTSILCFWTRPRKQGWRVAAGPFTLLRRARPELDSIQEVKPPAGQVFQGVGVEHVAAKRQKSSVADPSLRANATIDRQRVPGDKPSLVRQQEDDGIGDVIGLANAPHRNE